ncbi:hypothetical protein [Pseudobacillus badius]|uniref:hypothetical protein n=1 Tax=Bacillus badius TaxID=1455 RepID=UPI001CBCB9A6|nr:hypothetical protein [Bacillus badius]UAT32897.1 hypothetical protein K7T73_21640 [Bacillus badius]GLY12613.1 hypothetical protein Bbad01_38290 [Bacillus badius]
MNDFKKIVIEENDGSECIYELIDKILYNNKIYYLYQFEESYGKRKIMFFEFNPEEQEIQEVENIQEVIDFYKNLTRSY